MLCQSMLLKSLILQQSIALVFQQLNQVHNKSSYAAYIHGFLWLLGFVETKLSQIKI